MQRRKGEGRRDGEERRVREGKGRNNVTHRHIISRGIRTSRVNRTIAFPCTARPP